MKQKTVVKQKATKRSAELKKKALDVVTWIMPKATILVPKKEIKEELPTVDDVLVAAEKVYQWLNKA